MFLTRAHGVLEVDARGLGRVLEDGDVPWHGHGTVAEVASEDWSAKEHSGKLTGDAFAASGFKHRQRLAIG